MPGEIALDSNIIVDWLSGNRTYEERVQSYATIYLPVPVLGELLYGALISSQVEENLERLSHIVSGAIIIPCDEAVAEHFARIKASLKQIGKPIPETDIWISACCLKLKTPLATNDAHFDHIQSLKKEKW